MTASIMFKNIIEEVMEVTHLGLVLGGTGYSATTSTITQTDSTVTGSYNQQRIPRGCPILITAGAGANENTASNLYSPLAGTITVSPSITTGSTAAVLAYYDSGIDHFDRVKEAINRALNNRCSRKQFVPLTYVADGEMLGAVASYWTASAGTQTYASLTNSEVAAAQVLNITHSATASSTSNTIPAVANDQWILETAIRATTDGDTATLTILDVTNTTTITPSYQMGTGSTTSRSFITQRLYFTIPATCDRIAVKFTVSGSGTMAAQMAPVIAYPQNAMSFPHSNRIMSTDDIGNYMFANTAYSPSGPSQRTYSPPITTGGRKHWYSENGDHFVVSFNFAPGQHVYYEEQVYGPTLTAMTDTTTFPLEMVVRHSIFELYKQLAKKDKKKYQQDAIEAQRAARYNTRELINVVGRVG